jgi:hypothetical protein
MINRDIFLHGLRYIIQWRNIVSGGPWFKIFEGPLVEVPKAQVERRIYTSFLGGPGHAHLEKF